MNDDILFVCLTVALRRIKFCGLVSLTMSSNEVRSRRASKGM